MKFNVLVIIFIFIPTIFLHARIGNDTIRTDYSFWGNDYYLGTTKYSKAEIALVLEQNPSSKKYISLYKVNKALTYVALTAGTLFAGETIYIYYLEDNHYGPIHMPSSPVFYFCAGSAIANYLLSLLYLGDFKYQFNLAVKAFNNDKKNKYIS